jgi:phosphonate transport system permease protein
VTATGSLRAVALADLPGLRARHPGTFAVDTAARVKTGAWLALAIGFLLLGLWRLDVSLWRVLTGLGRLGSFIPLMLPPDPGSWARAGALLASLGETVAIAFLATVAAAIAAMPLGFLAASNTSPAGPVRFAVRRVLDAIRSVDALIWALIWINVVGLGPFAGILAIFVVDIGTLGKVFSEAIEATDPKPGEGVVASGGSDLARVRFGILPTVLPLIFGQVLYQFESNTRSSTIIGIVGAGGIGLYLSEMIRTLEWRTVSFIILLILVAVAIIDAISSRLRLAIIGRRDVVR